MRKLTSLIIACYLFSVNSCVFAQVVEKQEKTNPISEEVLKARVNNLSEEDCILRLVNTNEEFRLETKNGNNIGIYWDKLQRPVLLRNKDLTLQPIYDENIPQKIEKLIATKNGVTTEIAAPSTDVKEKVKSEISTSGLSLPRCSQSQMEEASLSMTEPPTQNKMEYVYVEEELWDDYGFEYNYTLETYWETMQQPGAIASQKEAKDREATASCVEGVTACNDVCDDAADKRGVACAIGAGIWLELPVGSLLYAVACTLASNKAKTSCKNNCKPLATCF